MLRNWSNSTDGTQREIQPTIEDIDSWSEEHPEWSSTSVRCSEVVAIDCDVFGKAVAEKIRDGASLFRRGFRRASVAAEVSLYAAPLSHSPASAEKYDQPDARSRGGSLCNVQQFIAFGIHPKTGKPYEWFGGDPLSIPVAICRSEPRSGSSCGKSSVFPIGLDRFSEGCRANYEEQERKGRTRLFR